MKDIILKEIALFLSILTVLSSVACSKQNTENDISALVQDNNEVNKKEPDEETTEPETEDRRIPGPEKQDLGGYNLRIAGWKAFTRFIHRDEQTGEAVNDALYNADLSVMNDYNCSIEVVLADEFPVVTNTVNASVQAGLDEFDLSYSHDCETVANVLRGDFIDIRSCDIFNLDAPWWTKTKDTFTIGGSMYFASSYLTYSPIYLGMILCYNKDLAADYQIEIPYEEIFAGNWYLDDLISMTQGTNRDLNGDGVMKLGEDQYGFIANSLGLVNFQVSLGGNVVGKDEDGFLVLNVDEERLLNMLEKFEKLMANGVDTIADGRWDYGTSYFGDGQGLFNYTQITAIPSMLTGKDVHYGTLPPPKLDELQKDYISAAFDCYWAIPMTAYPNLETIAVILEAKSQKCYYDVLPVSFETALKVRLSDSPTDAQTYEIIRDTMVVDPGYAFNEQNSSLADLIRIFSRAKSGEFSSFLKRVDKMARKGIDKINHTFLDMNERMEETP